MNHILVINVGSCRNFINLEYKTAIQLHSLILIFPLFCERKMFHIHFCRPQTLNGFRKSKLKDIFGKKHLQ